MSEVSQEAVVESSTEQVIEQTAQSVTEQVPQPVEPPKPLEDKLSSKFAALTRKEKAIKARESELVKQQNDYAKQLEAIKAENEKLKQEFEGYKRSIKESPLKKLEEEGLTFEQLTDMQLNNQNPTPEMLIQRVRSELESAYKADLESLKAQLAEKERKQQEDVESRTINQYKAQIGEHVTGNMDKYELLNITYDKEAASDLIYEVAEQFYNAEGRLLSVEEAADYAEKYLEEEAKKLTQAKKFKPQQPVTPAKQQSDKKQSMTLSNQLATEVPRGTSRKMTRDEEIAQVAKTIKFLS